MRKRNFFELPMLISIAAAVACGGSDPSTNSAAEPPRSSSAAEAEDKPVEGPCGLITKSEAEAVLRASIERPRAEGPSRTGAATRSSCFYRNRNGSVQVILTQYDTPAVAAERYRSLRERHKGSDTREVSGLGETAFWAQKQLVVHHGNAQLLIEVDFDDDRELKHYGDKAAIDALIAVEQQLAAEALKRVRPVTTS